MLQYDQIHPISSYMLESIFSKIVLSLLYTLKYITVPIATLWMFIFVGSMTNNQINIEVFTWFNRMQQTWIYEKLPCYHDNYNKATLRNLVSILLK